MSFATLGVDLVAKIAGFEEQMGRASKSVAALDNRFSAMAAGFKSFVGVVSVGGIAAFAKQGIDAADAMNDLADRTGVSVRALAEYQLAATQADTSLEALGKGIQKLSLSIGQAEQGSKEQAEALRNLGITARDPQQAFEQLADAVANSNDPIKTNADLQKVLGKNYSELLPLLQQGSKGLRESAAASEDFAAAMVKLAPDAAKFNDQLDELRLNAAGAAASLLSDLVPALNRTFDRLSTLARLRGAGASIVEIVTGGVSANVDGSLRNINEEIGGIESTIARLRRNSGGKDQSILPLENELKRLKTLRAELIAIKTEAIQTPPPSKSTASGKIGAASDDAIRLPSAVRSSRSGSSRPVDPLASLLSQTETARAAEYEKLLGMLEKRYDAGKVKAAQFGEAVALLNRQFGREQIDVFGSGSFITADSKAADAIRAQQEAINELNGEMAAEGVRAAEEYAQKLASLVADTDIVKTQTLYENIDVLNKAFFDGVIGIEQYEQALGKLTTGTAGKVEEMDEWAKNAARGLQGEFANFFKNFDKGTEGMAQRFGEMLKNMIAEAAAADLSRWLFGDLVKGGDGGGLVGSGLKWLGEMFSFDGGGYTGSGSRIGGVDGKGGFLSVLHPNETVVDHTRGQRMGGGETIIVNVNGTSAPDVRRAAAQGAREALGMLEGARRYG